MLPGEVVREEMSREARRRERRRGASRVLLSGGGLAPGRIVTAGGDGLVGMPPCPFLYLRPGHDRICTGDMGGREAVERGVRGGKHPAFFRSGEDTAERLILSVD
ncbi:hypothetical protein SSA02_14620 [Swaminathania salitolerans]|uniref:Uncharacterized protein n=1 Tax=Swaminathania salitolerans TaxID=182838 RepID=A0A511BPP2_9PROT|nr:hypothetical protein SSA02_14620 [Swaminathania salitolerans]